MPDPMREALDHAEGIVRGVPPGKADEPTLCDWSVARLVDHMIGGNLYFAASARGEEADWALFSQEHAGDDPAGTYRRSADQLADAWGRLGSLDEELPNGTAARFLWNISLVEVLGHGWDLAAATGQRRDIPTHLAQSALEIARQLPPEQVRSEAVFGPEVEAGPDATPADRFAAFLGRTAPATG